MVKRLMTYVPGICFLRACQGNCWIILIFQYLGIYRDGDVIDYKLMRYEDVQKTTFFAIFAFKF